MLLDMATGFQLGAVCYPNVGAAASSFVSGYPVISSGETYSISSSPVLYSNGFSVDLINGNSQVSTKTIYLGSCDTESLAMPDHFSFFLVIAMVILFGLGFSRS